MSDRTTRNRKSAAGIPGWIKVLGAAALTLVALFVALHLAGLMPMGHSM